MNAFNLYEAYAAVYNENLREDILTIEEDLSFVDDLSDNELVQVMESIFEEGEITLNECIEVLDNEILSEETEMERMRRLTNKRTREKKAEKSAERERVGRKHAMKRLQVAATRAGRNLADKVKSAGERAKTLGGGAVSAVAGGAAEAGRATKGAASATKEKVTGKLASAKEKIKGLIKSGRKAVAGGLRGLAARVEPKEKTGKEVKDAAKKTISGVDRRKAAEAKQKAYAAGGRGTEVMQGQPAGTFKSKKSREQARRREERLTASENYEILASYILEDLINEGYAETFEEAFTVLESFSDYEVGEIAENYLTEETESIDLYDVVLEHLLDEGYADTEEAATVIMANMSEEWRDSIVEEVLDEELTGKRKTTAIRKFNSQNENPGHPDTNLAAVATMRHGSRTITQGSSNIYPADRTDTGNRPTKRGGSGKKGEAKTGYYDGDRELDRGSGNAAGRRAARRRASRR